MKHIIKKLTEKNGIPEFPGADRVAKQDNGFFIAMTAKDSKTRTRSTLAIIRKDIFGNYVVAAEQEVLDTIPGGETINAFVKNDPSKWPSWKCDLADGTKDRVIETDKMRADVSSKFPVEMGIAIVVVGGKPVVNASLGEFRPDETEQTDWVGDNADLKPNENEVIK